MPKAVQYRSNSIIYFKGDQSAQIYLLNSGKISLTYVDIESGQEMHDLIKTGEFFGVKSALGHYRREETAVVLQDATVMVFTVPEFELLATKNTRIVTKMLKVFSNQLRRIHKQVQTLLVGDEQVNPETGLYKIGEYYMKNKRYAQALHAYKRYLVYYPSGAFSTDVTTKIGAAEDFLSRYGSGEPAAPGPAAVEPVMAATTAAPAVATAAAPAQQANISDKAQQYYNAVSLVSQEKYTEAFKAFKKIIDEGADPEYAPKAEFEMSKCLFYLKQYDSCIKSFTAVVQKFPKHPDMKDALFFVARSYEEKGDKIRAGGLFKKILSMGTEDDPVIRKVKKALRALEGGKA